MEPKCSLLHSQVPATCPYPEPAQSSPYPHIPLPEDHYYTKKSIKLKLIKATQIVVVEKFGVGAENTHCLACSLVLATVLVQFLPDGCFLLFCQTELVVIFCTLGRML
jgi:hypothetical protein